MSNNNTRRTEVEDLGEFGLIKKLTSSIKTKNSSSIKGIGDDAAVIDNENTMTLVSTDMLVENVHFDLTYSPLRHLGYKAATVNISDMAAMNAIAKQITVSIAVSNRVSVEALEEIYEGLKLACEKYKVDIVGGDTTSSMSGLIISVTVIGEARKEDIIYRNGAKENNLIVTTGDLGAAYMGLLVLEREKKVFQVNPNMQPDLSGKDYILQRQLKPEARADAIDMLKSMGIKPSAMIDISDGLASDILHICKDSNVGCNLFEDKIPVDALTATTAEEFDIDPTIAALSGGEDYELLFTVDQADYEKLKDNPHFHIIGHITDANSGFNLVSRSGQSAPLTAQGWDALLKKDIRP